VYDRDAYTTLKLPVSLDSLSCQPLFAVPAYIAATLDVTSKACFVPSARGGTSLTVVAAPTVPPCVSHETVSCVRWFQSVVPVWIEVLTSGSTTGVSGKV
jgi:hypothetical protein